MEGSAPGTSAQRGQQHTVNGRERVGRATTWSVTALALRQWWPAGPRPKQAQLYPRRLGLAEVAALAVGVETLTIGLLAGRTPVAQAGAGVLCLSAALSVVGVVSTWHRRPLPAPEA